MKDDFEITEEPGGFSMRYIDIEGVDSVLSFRLNDDDTVDIAHLAIDDMDAHFETMPYWEAVRIIAEANSDD